MSDPFVAEIRLFPGNFAPHGWALCNGQLLPISQNTALFSLLGTQYGGDGKSTFALPNLQGRVAVGAGQGPGLSNWDVGQSGGEATHALNTSEIPSHTHAVKTAAAPDGGAPSNTRLLARSSDNASLYHAPTNAKPMAAASVSPMGNSWAHNNRPPVLALNFIIALQGIFPPRS